MPFVNPTLPNDGEGADAADIAGPFLALLQVFNGHIGADNLEPGTIPAAIGAGDIDTAQLKNGAVTKDKLGDGAVTPDKVAGPINLTPSGAGNDVFTPLLTSRMNTMTFTKASTITVPSGTPQDGQTMLFRIRDNGTAWGITWNAIFRGWGLTLPSGTGGNNVYVTAVYNAVDTKWDVISVRRNA